MFVRAFARFASVAARRVATAPKAKLALGATLMGTGLASTAFLTAPTEVPRWGLPGTRQERTFLAIKPDGTNRRVVGEIIARFEKKGYKLVAMKFMKPTKEWAENHYSDLSKKPFFGPLTTYFSSGPVVAMVWEGPNVIKGCRKMLGATKPDDSNPGTIRGDYCIETGRNIIHGSDGPVGAENEIKMWFTDEEIVDWEPVLTPWTLEL
eukprot:TRINITY_DN531274_c5_g1_i1.p1 TRINITY_DN531274_c5_g1~~TRINITY_DN531274_c5_g1_i1.p1  ORF type:complete len:208 (-),score=63.13 TRINITY_DN531274_c5_g1_i1:163-786(-)